MRLLTGAALAAVLFATAASAQQTPAPAADPPPTVSPTACAPLPERPATPDGATATRPQMDAASTAFTAWGESYRAGIACRRQEAASLRATLDARIAEHNQAAENLNTQIAAWQAEATEFNTLHPARPPRTAPRRSSN